MATVVTLTPHLFKELQYNIDTDVVPVAMIGTSPMMLTVNPSLGVNSVADLVKMAKSQPGKLNFALPLLNSGSAPCRRDARPRRPASSSIRSPTTARSPR